MSVLVEALSVFSLLVFLGFVVGYVCWVIAKVDTSLTDAFDNNLEDIGEGEKDD